jgi:hypothetical protein
MNIYQPTTKHCIYCNTIKSTTEFYKDNKRKDKIKIRCKCCDDIYQQEYHKKRKEKKLLEKHLALSNKTSKLCKVCKIDKPFIEFNKSNDIKDGYKTTCIECNTNAILERKQKRREQTIANIPIRKEKQKKYMTSYTREKCAKDPLFKLTSDIRKTIGSCLRKNGYTKRSKTYEILGCSFKDFYNHIEQQFTDDMSWDNKGRYGWHIDHIVPLSFGTTLEEIHLLNHYTNLRPLWAKDNIVKGDTLTKDVIQHPIYKSILNLRSTKNF